MINKKVLLIVALLFTLCSTYAQRPSTYDGEKGEKYLPGNRLFIGGSLNLGFASNTFQVGAVPEIGYSVTDWFDAGLGININYSSERADPYYNYNVRTRSFNYGGGPFIRLYPIHFLFIQGQLEENWIKVNQKDYNTGLDGSATFQSTSLIAGIGYAQRIVGQNNFYTMIGIDLMRDPNSPYRDYNGSAIPIIRAGFNFYLKPSHRK